MSKFQKPFLKWAGGKTQIINSIISKFPKEINNYHEIFLGGGSVLLALLSSDIKIKKNIYVYDLNKGLINCYNQIKNNIKQILEDIKNITDEFNSIKINTEGQRGQPSNINAHNYKTTREHYYYWIREKYNQSFKNTSLDAAYFIFLNKTGFKGMFREGKNGFNVPYGKKDVNKIPQIIDLKEILNIHNLIQNVIFECLSFEESIKNIKNHDFVYLDPPYAPENKESFVNYINEGFNIDKHELLFNLINQKKSDFKFVMSNSNVDLVKDNFKDCNCDIIEAKRRINSKKPESKTEEVIIYN